MTMKDWINLLISEKNKIDHKPEYKEVVLKRTTDNRKENININHKSDECEKIGFTQYNRWPYSSFFDWFDKTTKDGFLPFILDKNVKASANPSYGLDGKDYKVNTNYIFVGLNPARPYKHLAASFGRPKLR